MDFDYTPRQEQLRKDYRARLEAVMTPERRAAVAGLMEGGDAMTEARHALGEAGLLGGVAWPVEYGGHGLTALEQYIFGEEARRVHAPLPMITLNTVGPTLIQYGTDEQKNTFLPAILKGTVDFAIGYSEPGAGSDLASLRTTAVRDGNEWVINGSKMFTSGAAFADYIWLAARTDPNAKKHKGDHPLHRPDRQSRLFVEAAAHHARSVHVLHVLRRRAGARQRHRARRERWLEAGHQPTQPGAGRAGQPWSAGAAVPPDARLGQEHPRWTANA